MCECVSGALRYEVDDLRVTDILSQMVVLSETYMQIFELKQPA